ncbi:MAG: hypothetical protein QG656_1729 [Candidatus Hydrogenedentes bacterium]|nr:hypothetical protein [Candidatus Hydrogenedentota bacterium]
MKLLLVSGVVLIAVSANVRAAERFVQDRFAIGFWVDPPADARMDDSYREIAEANFTLVLGSFGANSPDTVARQLELCRKYDLKVLVWGGGDPSTFPDDSVCWGYMVRDEPSADDFPALRERVNAIRAARPGKMAYINLFPSHAGPKRLGTPTYDEHVARFVREVCPEVLSMDHYPRFAPGVDGRDAYCEDLAVMRTQSLAGGIPFWNFFNTMPYGPHTDPTEAQLRWQIYTSLAYGAKGVLYFCYYTPFSDEFPKGGAIIGRDGRKTRHYEQAKRINGAVKNLGPALMKLTSMGVYRVKPDDDPAAVLAGTPLKNLTRADHDPKPDYLIGVFAHEDGRRAVMLNNYQFAYTAWPTVEFDAEPAQVIEVDQQTGQEHPVIDDSPDMDGLQISLDAGEGRLFLLPPK